MPKKNPVTTYNKRAARTPSKRTKPLTHASHKIPMKKPRGTISDMVDYVEAHRVEVTKTTPRPEAETLDLIHDFQDQCKHTAAKIEIASSPTKRIVKCPTCNFITEAKAKAR